MIDPFILAAWGWFLILWVLLPVMTAALVIWLVHWWIGIAADYDADDFHA